MGDTRLGADGDPAVQNALIADVLERALRAGEESVRRGPEQLAVLRESGVVDAGGHALTVIFAGVIAALRGTEAPAVARQAAPARISHPRARAPRRTATARTSPSPGASSTRGRWIEPLEAIGDSVLVVGDAATLKVHVHTDEPGGRDGAVRRRRRGLAPRRRRHARAGPGARRAPRAAAAHAALRRAGRRRRRRDARAVRVARRLRARRRRRRSTRRPTSCSPGSTTCPPRRSSCCRTRRTSSWPPSTRPSCRRRSCA